MNRMSISALLFTGFVTTACGGDPKSGGEGEESVAGRIGVVLPTAAQPAYKALEDGLRKGLDDAGHQLVVEGRVNDAAQQAALIQRFTARKAIALVIAPLDSTSLNPALTAAASAGIPVFTVGIPVSGGRATTHLEPDYFGAGVAAGEYMAAFLGSGMRAAVVGRLGAHGGRELQAGFRSVMRLDTTKVMTVAESSGAAEEATAVVTGLLDADNSLDAIFALDAATALGAMTAAYAERRADLVIVSFGANEQTLSAIRDARALRAAIVERPDEAARLLSEAIATQLEGAPVTPSIKAPVRLVNVDSLKTP